MPDCPPQSLEEILCDNQGRPIKWDLVHQTNFPSEFASNGFWWVLKCQPNFGYDYSTDTRYIKETWIGRALTPALTLTRR